MGRVFFVAIAVCVFGTAAFGQPWAGNGTAEEPYQIWDACDMQAIGADPNYWNSHFKLMADIDLGGFTGTSFNIIGNHSNAFTGVFDGNSHTISNFNYNTSGATGLELDGIGIFRHIKGEGDEAVIKNVGLIDPNVISENGDYIGSLIGKVGQGPTLIENCYANGAKVSGNEKVGGLIGAIDYHWTVTVSNCSAIGDVSGNKFIGGLIGFHYLGTISKCWANCNVKGDDLVGGLVGYDSEGDIIESWSNGSVVGDTWVGGLTGGIQWLYEIPIVLNCYSTTMVDGNNEVGGLTGNNSGNLCNSFSAGKVVGTSSVGGLVGYDSSGDYTKCFWNSDVNPGVNGIGNTTDPNVIGKSTEEMQTESTFIEAGWDFVGEIINGPNDIWDICEGMNYPKLSWQIPPAGDFVCPDGIEMNDLAVLCEEWLFEEIPADVWPEGGDGIVNFFDWAVFANQWQITADFEALADFAEQWLETGARYCIADIAPAGGGDGIVNMVDFAVFANNWLKGL